MRLVVMAKAPRPGRVKTRLAATVGDDAAARVAAASLLDTWSAVASAPGIEPQLALAGDAADLPRSLVGRAWIVTQGDGDLGARMTRHLAAGCRERGACLMVGADAPGVPAAALERARAALETHDAVLGPAEDGGFWLIGLRGPVADGLLDELPWSAPDTCARTLGRLRERGYRVALASTWFDVDEASDLSRLCLLHRLGVVAAPRVAAAAVGLTLPEPSPARPPADLREAPEVSVVLPVLDEIARLPGQLVSLLGHPGLDEVIVADGGSRDGTRELAAAFPGVRLVDSPPGRARQMNAGAALARAETLLFLHADVGLPHDAVQHIRAALVDPGVVGGAFKTHTVPDGGRWHLGRLLRLADGRSRYTRHPYGDQAPFVRAAAFRALGGYPDQPLMEDVEFSRRLVRRGRVARCSAEVRVSGRRFQARPVYYTTLVNVFPLLYRLGVPARTLASLYRHTR